MRMMKRRTVLLLAAVGVVLLLASGVALAVNKGCSGDCVGTREADTLSGSTHHDRIAGMEGDDIILGFLGDDQIYGDEGNDTLYGYDGTDTIYGDEGNDIISVEDDGTRDTVDCGQGRKDKVWFDEGLDVVTRCEIKNPGL